LAAVCSGRVGAYSQGWKDPEPVAQRSVLKFEWSTVYLKGTQFGDVLYAILIFETVVIQYVLLDGILGICQQAYID